MLNIDTSLKVRQVTTSLVSEPVRSIKGKLKLIGSPIFDSAIITAFGTVGGIIPAYDYDILVDIYAHLIRSPGLDEDEVLKRAVRAVNEQLALLAESTCDLTPAIVAKQDNLAEVSIDDGEIPMTINGVEWVLLNGAGQSGVISTH